MPQRSERIRALASASRFRVGATLVYPERLAIERDGVASALEPRIMEVLVALAERAGEVVSAEQLLIEVWRGTFYGDNPVHRAIAQLRRHLGDPSCIATIRKRGYRLVAPVAFPEDYRTHPLQASGWTGRDPYVGLSAFDASHAEVFFGRTRQTADTLAALRAQRESGRGLVLLVGASGCGKSSLLQAGVLPLLRQPGGFDRLHAIASAHCDFAAAQADALGLRLATALAEWRLDDRPFLPPQPAEQLAARLALQPELVTDALDEAWRRRATANQSADGFALLTVDHAESLVVDNRLAVAVRQQLWRTIEAVSGHPHAACIMVVRADYYPALLAALPGLAERKGGDGHVDLLPPRSGEIAQIVRMPALLAGLKFDEESTTALRLDDVLRDAAAEQPDALPLLQHTLQALFERRDENGTLSFAAYRAIGGLEGALAQRAESTYADLPAAVRARLETVLARMITVSADSARIGSRRVLRASLPDVESIQLVDAFVAARLFVAGSDHGRPDVGVAHEALLRQWPRVRDWIYDNRRQLQARARLHRAAARWDEVGRRNDHLLAPGLPLQEAIDTMRSSADPLSVNESALIEASQRRQRRQRRTRQFASLALAVLCALTTVMALWAAYAQQEAEQRRREAVRLTDFMLADLADKLRPLGHLALLDDVGRQALEVLGSDDSAQMNVAELVNRARALRMMGEVQMQEGNLSSALTAFQAAARAAEAANLRAPGSIAAIAESGTAAYWLGYYHFRRKDFPNAAGHWRRYLTQTEALLALAPDEPRWLIERSYALNNLGTLAQSEGRNAEALARFRESADLKRRVLLLRPDDTDLRFEMLDTLSWISAAERAEGRLNLAAEGFAAQLSMLRTLTAERPTALAWERRLANLLRRSGVAALERGAVAEARQQLDESIARLEVLLPKALDNRVWHRDLAHGLLERANLARIEGDAAGEERFLRRSEALAAKATLDGDVPAEWHRMSALIAIRLAVRQSSAIAEAQTLDRLSQLVDQAPDDLYGRVAFAGALISRGRRLAQVGLPDQAERDFARTRDLLRSVAPDSRDPSVLAPWVAAHLAAGLPAPAESRHLTDSRYRHPDYVGLGALPVAQSVLRP